MPRVSEMKPEDHMKVMVYGKPKSGKTFFAGTWPKPGFLDADHGIKVLSTAEFKRKHPKADDAIYEQPVDDNLDEKGIIKTATGMFDAIKKLNELANNEEIKTIVIDSLTSFSVLAMHAGLVAQSKGARPRSNTLKEARADGIILLGKQDFGAEMGAVEQLLDQILPIKKHVLVIAHERENTTDSGMVIGIDPLITGSRLRSKIARWFDDVWYMDTEGEGDKRQHVLITKSDRKLKTVGSRLGLSAKIEDPSYEKIINQLKKAR